MNDWNTAALHDRMARQDRADEQRKWLEREAQEMEFDTTAEEHAEADLMSGSVAHDFGPSLFHEVGEEMVRIFVRKLRPDLLPAGYAEGLGVSDESRGLAAIESWLEAHAQQLADKWIEEQI